jgi:hypothetical protein
MQAHCGTFDLMAPLSIAKLASQYGPIMTRRPQ